MANTKVLMQGEVNVQRVPDKVIELEEHNKPIDELVIKKSENSGNDHVLKCGTKGIISYEKDGVLYAALLEESTLECTDTKRHESITLTPGIYSFTISKEYNPIDDGMGKPAPIVKQRTTPVAD